MKNPFDGDQYQIRVLLDSYEKEGYKRLASHLGIMDADRANKISGFITMHAEGITNLNQFRKHYLAQVVERYNLN